MRRVLAVLLLGLVLAGVSFLGRRAWGQAENLPADGGGCGGVADLPLGGEAGNTQFDPASRQIFVAVHGVNQLVGIDPSTDQVASRSDVPGCKDPHGLAINPARRTASVACEGNAKLVVIDMQTMQAVS